jgi:general stress protein 26
LATVKDNKPSNRVVDTYYEDGVFWVVTYGLSNKVKAIEENCNVALCNNFYSFKGSAFNVGHPLKEENKKIRERLIKEFEPWYFAHNNENDENMCYVKIVLTEGFFHKDGQGYKVDFTNKKAEEFPFAPDAEL